MQTAGNLMGFKHEAWGEDREMILWGQLSPWTWNYVPSCAVTCYGLSPLSQVSLFILHRFCLISNSLCIQTLVRFPNRVPELPPIFLPLSCVTLLEVRPQSSTWRKSRNLNILTFSSVGCWHPLPLISTVYCSLPHKTLTHTFEHVQCVLQLGSGPVQTVYLPVMTTVQRCVL